MGNQRGLKIHSPSDDSDRFDDDSVVAYSELEDLFGQLNATPCSNTDQKEEKSPSNDEINQDSNLDASEQKVTSHLRRSTRTRKEAKTYDAETGTWKPVSEANIEFGWFVSDPTNVDLLEERCSDDHLVPDTYEEARNCKDRIHWKKAIDEELAALESFGTYKLVLMPEKTKAKSLQTQWVFRIKQDANGNIVRYKALLVVRGDKQKYAIDYDETFSPVIKFQSVRALISFWISIGATPVHKDVDSAFLNSYVNQLIYVRIPVGAYTPSNGLSWCWLLLRGLYGLRQAPLLWNHEFVQAMNKGGFVASKSDPCVFIFIRGKNFVLLGLCVDDIILGATCSILLADAKSFLMGQFEMKQLGRLEWFLGLKITYYDDGSAKLHQSVYIQKLIDLFDTTNCKTRFQASQGSKRTSSPSLHSPIIKLLFSYSTQFGIKANTIRQKSSYFR